LFRHLACKAEREVLVSSDLFKKWLKSLPASHQDVTLYCERPGARALGLKVLKGLLAEHFVGEATIVQAGGYKKAAAIITNSLPSNKKTQSGDLGELLATEYLNAETPFVVPIKKLRWKSDRQMAMHGNDVIGVDTTKKPVRVLKGECKSRATFGKGVVAEAVASLDLHDGRPNPSTLAFIAKRLYEEKRDEEANVFRDLQCGGAIAAKNVTHMIFTLSGNDPVIHLAGGPKSQHAGIKRENAAIIIADHGAFLTSVYKTHGA
jgi:uncharacterized protein DUF1837